MSYDSDSDTGMRRAVGGRRRRGRGATGGGIGERDPAVHLAKGHLAMERAMEGMGSPAMRHRRNQKATHAHMIGSSATGGAYTGGGFLSDLGIPIISNLAGAIGLGHTGGSATGGRSHHARVARHQEAQHQARMNEHLGAEIEHLRRLGSGSTGGRRGRGSTGGAYTGGGFLSDLGIPIISNLAGAIGLGRRRGRGSTGGMMLGQNGHGQQMMGMGATGGLHRQPTPRQLATLAREELALHQHEHEAMGGRRRGRGATGAGFWDDFKSGFNSVISPVAKIAKAAIPFVAPELAPISMGLNALGYGHTGGMATGGSDGFYDHMGGGSMEGCGATGGRRRRATAGPNDGRRVRAELVRKVMRERGCSLPEASSIVKREGMY
jgi:hypothetical protein